MSLRTPVVSFITILLFVLMGIARLASCQTVASEGVSPPASLITLDKVQTKIAEVEARNDIAAAVKEQAQNFYQQAKSHLEAAASYDATIDSYTTAINSGPLDISRASEKLKKLKIEPVTPELKNTLSNLPLDKVEQDLIVIKTELVSLREKQSALTEQLQKERLRPLQITDEIAAANQNLKEIEEKIRTFKPAGEPPLLAEARQAVIEASQQASARKVTLLNKEILSHDIRVELLALNLDIVRRQVDKTDTRAKLLENVLSDRRQADAKQIEVEAQATMDLSARTPAVRGLAEENVTLGQELTLALQNMEGASAALQATENRMKQVEADFEKAKQKVEVAGLSRTIGQVLLQERYRLPDPEQTSRESRRRQKELADIWLKQLKVDEQRASLQDMDGAVEALMKESIGPQPDPGQAEDMEREIRSLLLNQETLLKKLSEAYSGYLKTLGNLEIARSRFAATLKEFAAFLDERVLWIPSTSALNLQSVKENIQAAGRLLSVEKWREVGNALIKDVAAAPHVTIMAILFFGALIWSRQRLSSRIDSISAKVTKPYSFRFSYTLKAILVTMGLALPGPLFLLYLGWRLSAAAESPAFVQAVSEGLSNVVLPYLYFQTFYYFCWKNGVATVHLQWHDRTLAAFRRNLPWFASIFLSAIAAISILWTLDHSYRGRIGVPLFVAVMAALSLFIYRVIRHRVHGTGREALQDLRGWQSLSRRFSYPVLIVTPLLLAGFSALGYFYTAVQIARHIHLTVWLIAGAFIIHDLVIRWLMVAHYQLTLQVAREKQDASSLTGAADNSADAVPEKLDIQKIDISTVSHKTRQLLNFLIGLGVLSGLWIIWEDIFPAFKILDQVTLWDSTVFIDGQQAQETITLANVGLAAVLIVVSTLFVRNIPSFLEIVLLQRLPITSGSRYAITKITQYVIITIGTLAVFNAMGGSWSQIHWLVAALGVGLGFGLQEIFGNFVSGLIILFERPIRVGDTVTVGDISGTVSRIRIRATTITDWDNKELIVPNKTFITQQLINWTLSDPITRLKIEVGVAYGSDTALTHRVILNAVKANPLALRSPEPRVYFIRFGNSSLDFIVYFFIKDMSHRLVVTHELHMAIEQALRENGINIPFPQRDIHIRSAEGLAKTRHDNQEKKGK